eukprot:5955058-Pyramimonas_sp.AAC.1
MASSGELVPSIDSICAVPDCSCKSMEALGGRGYASLFRQCWPSRARLLQDAPLPQPRCAL